MRLVLRGRGSFIARKVAQAARNARLDILELDRNTALDDLLNEDDVLINFALAPAYRTEAYQPENDLDRAAAGAAANAGAGFVLLSSRRVYPANQRWNAHEDAPAPGDETQYGRNKASTEAAVRQVTSGAATILRLSNVFGMEYQAEGVRETFFGQMLRDLRNSGRIRFQMAAETRRDFIPVEDAALSIVKAATARAGGTYNLGSGLPVSCGEVAKWVTSGYGTGEMDTVGGAQVYDEFCLNMTKWTSTFGPATDGTRLQAACELIGLRLRDA